MQVEFEFEDGTCVCYTAADHQDAWDLVALVDGAPFDILSAWRDDEPWFGRCTDMQEGTP
jgi:dTDP-4-dehydrorhamnose 3,5-epimerase-like enzyme